MANSFCVNCGGAVEGVAFCATCGTPVAAAAGGSSAAGQAYSAPTYSDAAAGKSGKPLQTGRLTFVEAIKSFFANYVNFEGRATQSAYWYVVLFSVIVSAVTSRIDAALTGGDGTLGSISSLVSLALFLPGLSVAVRRLHDTGRSARSLWFLLLPLVGPIMLIVWAAGPSEPRDNQYGPRP